VAECPAEVVGVVFLVVEEEVVVLGGGDARGSRGLKWFLGFLRYRGICSLCSQGFALTCRCRGFAHLVASAV